ncbi:MAG: beta-lactamase family protein [Candidatus Eremiobacteraeota bacterium]|nr:beta-lactamase family protein [Candidatus Eremiobacteraeota bacterium]
MVELFAECDTVLRDALDRRYTAAVARVERHGRVLFERAYGRTRADTFARPIAIDTRFDLASLTKLFVATIALDAVARGRFALDDSLVGAIPEWRNLPQRAITMRNILAHTAGMQSGAHYRSLRDRAVEEFALTTELQGAVGEAVLYSDLGFIALGVAIARREERSLQSILEGFVARDGLGFRPHVQQWGAIPATECDAWRGRVQGRVHDEKAYLCGGVAGHAGLFGSAADAAWIGEQFLAPLHGRESVLERTLAQEAVREQAFDPTLRRALGWALKTREDNSCGPGFSRDSFGHTGFTGTCIWVDPQRDLTAVLLSNTVYYGREDSTDLRRAFFTGVTNAVDRPS